MKKAILLALYTFLVSSTAWAGWNEWGDVWPSTNHWRFTNDAEYATFTNAFCGVKITAVFTATAEIGFTNWSTNGFYYYNPDTNSFWATYGGGASSYDYGVVPRFFVDSDYASSSNSFTVTNSYWVSMNYGTNYGALSYVDFNLSNDWYAVQDGVTNNIIETYVGATTNILIPEISLNVKELRVLEAYLSLKDRANAGFGSPGVPSFFRHDEVYWLQQGVSKDERDWLVTYKQNVKALIPSFLDLSLYETNANLDTWLATDTNMVISNAVLTVSNLCDNVSIATNYFDWTPYRQLNGWGFPFGHVVTQSVTLYDPNITGTNLLTNTVYDYVGFTNVLTGTNGQIVTLYATNHNVLTGYTELDYGWKPWSNIMAQLKQTYVGIVSGSAYDIVSTNLISTDYSSWTNAISSCTTNSGYANEEYGTFGSYFSGSGWYIAQSFQNEKTYKAGGLSTNVNKTVDFYIRAGRATSTTNSVFDANGFDITDGAMRYFTSSAETNGATAYATNGWGTALSAGNWTADPYMAGTTNSTFRGFTDSEPATYYFVVKWSFDFD